MIQGLYILTYLIPVSQSVWEILKFLLLIRKLRLKFCSWLAWNEWLSCLDCARNARGSRFYSLHCSKDIYNDDIYDLYDIFKVKGKEQVKCKHSHDRAPYHYSASQILPHVVPLQMSDLLAHAMNLLKFSHTQIIKAQNSG